MDQEKRRLKLHEILENIPGVKRAYFQPPEDIRMIYPCIRYERTNGLTEFADNVPYGFTMRYAVMVIDTDPDSRIVEEIAKLPMCTFDRCYSTDNLYHSVFTLYF